MCILKEAHLELLPREFDGVRGCVQRGIVKALAEPAGTRLAGVNAQVSARLPISPLVEECICMILWRVFVFLPGFLSSLLQLMPCCVWMPLCAWACSHASSQRRGLFPGKTFCCCCEYPCRELRINFANLLGPFLLLNLYAACGPFARRLLKRFLLLRP